MKLHSKRVVVVGGSSGIGLGVAHLLQEEGAEVIIVGRNQARLDAAIRELRAANLEHEARVTAVVADVSIEPEVKQLFESIRACDHVVTTAADLAYHPVSELDMTAARRAIDSKLTGALLLAKHSHPQLTAGGSLTFTSGVAGDRPRPRGALTAMVNSGLEGLVRALAVELAPIRVNVVSPGWVDTPMWDVVAGEHKGTVQAEMATRLPVRRLGTPQDMAAAFVFLIKNGFCTGTVLHVDGGHRLV